MPNDSLNDDRLAIGIGEAVRITGLSRSKLYELMSDGEVDWVNVGRRRLVLVDSLRRFFARLQAAA